MKQFVTLKGNKYGITIRLDAEASFPELIEDLASKLRASADFFKDAKMVLSIEGRELTPEEEDQVLDTFAANSHIHVICIMDSDEQRQELYRMLVEEAEQIEAEEAEEDAAEADEQTGEQSAERDTVSTVSDVNMGQFYKGTLRSGQAIESVGNLIVLGDINPGAKAVAAGNIIVLGSLKGYAVAGAAGNSTAFVVALEMQPMQIRIGNVIGRSVDKKKKKGASQPQIAYVLDGGIYIEDISREVMKDIQYKME